MTLYQEIPKQSIMSELQKRHTPEELDAVRLELDDLLHSCRTLDELTTKVYMIIHAKKALNDYIQVNQDSFRGM